MGTNLDQYYRTKADGLEDENYQLREALKQILQLSARHDLTDAWRIARRALENRR